MDEPDPAARIARLLELQAGVISRHQALANGWGPHDVRRLRRRREWADLLPGVYVAHTGAPTWLQRAWGAVLYADPAALFGRSALRVEAGPAWRGCPDAAPIEVAIDLTRTVVQPPGVRIHRVSGLEGKARWGHHPPRMRVEEATIDHALAQSTTLDMVEALASVCRARVTTADRLLETLAARARVSERHKLTGVLADIRDGTCSVLEHGYLDRVERPHGLPAGRRQGSDLPAGSRVYRDVEYPGQGLVVELDGRLHERGRQRDADLDRDLDLALTGRGSVRLGWGQVFDRACATAQKVGRLLQRNGWTGEIRPCGHDCSAIRAA